jgi:hypothetical protein
MRHKAALGGGIVKGKDWFALILILLGLVLLGDNLGLFRLGSILRLWPVVLIILGLWVFVKKDENRKKATVEVSFSTGKAAEPSSKVEPEAEIAEVKAADDDDDEEDEI